MEFKCKNDCECPYCHELINMASGFRESDKPKHDDFTVCGACGGICCWVKKDGVVSLRKAEQKDLDEAQRDGYIDGLFQLQDFVKGKSGKIITPNN